MAPIHPYLASLGGILTGWLLVAAFPLVIWIASAFADKTRKPALIGSVVIGIVLTIACLLIDFWMSFGEAFVEGVEKGRRPIWLGLTALATIVFSIIAARKPKQAEQAEQAEQAGHGDGG